MSNSSHRPAVEPPPPHHSVHASGVPVFTTRPTHFNTVALFVPVVLALALAAWWTLSGLVPVGGDEPHYLVMADSIARDGNLELRNDYARDARTGAIFGQVEPHAYRTDRGWYPYHTPGLSILLALPYRFGGVLVSRLTLCVFALGLPLVLMAWVLPRLGARDAAWLTLAATLSVPFVFGASEIYPDLPGAVIALFLAVWLIGPRPTRWNGPGWAAFWLLAGLIAWLNIKFMAVTAVAAACGLFVARGERRDSGGRQGLLLMPLVVVGPALLALFHLHAFGSVLGERDVSELTRSPARALMILLGLHFDQSQGMFLQQPLLLCGIPALAWWMRRAPGHALSWIVLYGALILPNSLQMARFGGGGPIGRFGWSAAWLWLIPLVIAAQQTDRLRRWIRPLALVSIGYQAALAWRWIPRPRLLFPLLDERTWARESLFPVDLRLSVPSFYFWDFSSYLSYLPNLLAVGGAVFLFVSGWLATSNVARRRLRRGWLGFAVVCGLLLPVSPRAGHGSPEQEARDRDLLRESTSTVTRRFEAERMTPRSLEAETTRTDAAASEGAARSNRPARADHMIILGPNLELLPGRYRATLALRLVDASAAGTVGAFDVVADRGRTLLASGQIEVGVLRTNAYTTVSLLFESNEPIDAVEFRFITEDGPEVLLDYVDLVPILPHPAMESGQ